MSPNESNDNSLMPPNFADAEFDAAQTLLALRVSNESRGNDSRGNDPRGNDSRGHDSRGNDSRGNDSRGNDSRGNESCGNDSRGNDSGASDSRGNVLGRRHRDSISDGFELPHVKCRRLNNLELVIRSAASSSETLPAPLETLQAPQETSPTVLETSATVPATSSALRETIRAARETFSTPSEHSSPARETSATTREGSPPARETFATPRAESPPFSLTPRAESPSLTPRAESPSARLNSLARPGNPRLTFRGFLGLPTRPHCVNPRACVYSKDCKVGNDATRKGVSHFFGRNKKETLKIPLECWPVICRKHYQRMRYRNDKLKRFYEVQLETIGWALEGMERHMSPINWTIQFQKGLQDRLNADNSRYRQNHTTQQIGVSESPENLDAKAQELTLARELEKYTGKDKSTDEVRAFLARMEAACMNGEVTKLIGVEFLPTQHRSYAPPR